MSGDGNPIAEVIPLGAVSMMACEVVAAHLQALWGLDTAVSLGRDLPPGALLQRRGQYDAAVILTFLTEDLAQRRLRIGVTSRDLCLPIFTFVFGEALVNGRVAVVSTARLLVGTRPAEMAQGLERCAKVAMHETAHSLGLTHCTGRECLMTFTSGLEHLDRLRPELCPACDHHLATRLALWREAT